MNNKVEIVEKLELKCALQEQQIAELTAKLTWFEEQFRLSQHRRFVSSSEKTNQDQLQLFNEAAAEEKPSLPEPAMEELPDDQGEQAPPSVFIRL